MSVSANSNTRASLPLMRALTLAAALLCCLPTARVAAADAAVIEQGKQLAFAQRKGNCLACHKIEDGVAPGNLGPALVNMKARYPDKAKLREQIWDATRANVHSIMPPYGKYRILTEPEIDKLVEYIYTL